MDLPPETADECPTCRATAALSPWSSWLARAGQGWPRAGRGR